MQKSNGEHLSSPFLEIFQLSVQSVCPVVNVQCRFNASLLKKADFRLFEVLSAVSRFLSNYLPCGSDKPLTVIIQMALVHM